MSPIENAGPVDAPLSSTAAPTPALTLVGADAPVCVDGVCEIPGLDSPPVGADAESAREVVERLDDGIL
ncbi:hypothetical protein [Schumannella sp. 10F1B-5-1]|uniref:hypothetical protein n=1 Tax=Schumannella sp. 10F1B-5-1 TaxID=2590780 RepID=UPI00113055BF|nr:hypothetical protein [Schumannella sp. 10F1B-5-1]TPW70810.1 hypothetical protein FJ658_11845 [Schumannella sp. 10F1B-5-1]